MRVPKKISFFVGAFIINVLDIYAEEPPPIDPNDGTGQPPPPIILPVNDFEWILWLGALLLAGYILTNNIKYKKAPSKQ